MNKSSLLLLLSILILGCPLVEENNVIEVNKPVIIGVKEGLFSINLSWDRGLANYYRLYLKNNNSWSLVEDYIFGNSHRVLDFKFDKELSYGLSAFYKGSESGITPIDTIKINKSELYINDIYIESFTYTDALGLNFSDLPGSYKYHIYRDGEFLNTTFGTSYKDRDVEKGRIYKYSLAWENLITGDIGDKSPLYPGVYGDILDPDENKKQRLLETNLDGFIYQYKTLIDRDLYIVPVNRERTSYLTISAPVGYGKGSLYLNDLLVKEFSLPIRDLELTNSSTEDKLYTLEITGLDRGENYIKGYSMGIKRGAISPPENLRIDIVNKVVNLYWDSSLSCALYRREILGDWELLAKDLTDSYSDTNLEVGKDYIYGVSARSGEVESKFLESSLINLPKESVFVTGLKVKSLYSTNSIFLSWNVLDSSYEYQIYRSSSKLDLGTKVGTTTGQTYRDLSSSSLIKDTLYYYRVIWRDPVNNLDGPVPSYGHPGIYSDSIDTREPIDNFKENIVSDSLVLGEDLSSILYKKGDFIDRDWFRYIVPGLTSRYLTASGLDGKALVNIYSGELLISTREFSFSDIELLNLGSGDKVFFIEVLPKSGSGEFIESYRLNISDF